MAPPLFPIANINVASQAAIEKPAANIFCRCQYECSTSAGCSRRGAKPFTSMSRAALLGTSAVKRISPKCRTSRGHIIELKVRPKDARAERYSPKPHFFIQSVDSSQPLRDYLNCTWPFKLVRKRHAYNIEGLFMRICDFMRGPTAVQANF